MKVVRYLWALPATCVGAVVGAICLLFGASVHVVDGVIEVAGAFPRRGGFGAITLGHVIVGLDRECLDACRAHEHVHVRQYERWGVLFFPIYLGSSLIAWMRGGDPYRDNVFEKPALAVTPPRDGASGRTG